MGKNDENEIAVLKEKRIQMEKTNDELKETLATQTHKISVSSQTNIQDDKLMLPCTECIFTASSEMELRVHMDYVHDKEDPDFDTTYQCIVCKKKFLEKCKLMKRITSQYENSVQTCRFFLRGICNFEDNIC